MFSDTRLLLLSYETSINITALLFATMKLRDEK